MKQLLFVLAIVFMAACNNKPNPVTSSADTTKPGQQIGGNGNDVKSVKEGDFDNFYITNDSTEFYFGSDPDSVTGGGEHTQRIVNVQKGNNNTQNNYSGDSIVVIEKTSNK